MYAGDRVYGHELLENEVDELEWGFDLDHTGASTQNIAVYLCPSSERRDPSQDLTDGPWDMEGPYLMARGNYAACWAREIYINKTNPDGTPAPSPLDGLFGVTFIPGWNTTYSEQNYLGSVEGLPYLRRPAGSGP